MNSHISFDEGWKVLEQGIVKCSKILECPSTRPTVAEYMNCYDCAYRMAVQKKHYCQEMYNGFKTTLTECVRSMVLPHLTQKKNDHFFRELVRMWSNYCTMIRFVTGFFSYLDRCYLDQHKLPSLNDTSAATFFGTVFFYFSNEARDSLLAMIRQERDGSMVNMELLDVLRGISSSEVKTLMRNAVLEDTYGSRKPWKRKPRDWLVICALQMKIACISVSRLLVIH